MITRMDGEIGRILATLEELGLEENTLVVFTSDNGPTFTGGVDFEFFESAGGLRGLKQDLYEGGIRVPMIARWPGRIAGGTVSDLPSAFQDYMATFADLLDREPPGPVDGISLLPEMRGRAADVEDRSYLYWEFQGMQAIRQGRWKGFRMHPDSVLELYDLETDRGETADLAVEQPDRVVELERILAEARTESELFPLRRENQE
jgi:arylsulfatase A